MKKTKMLWIGFHAVLVLLFFTNISNAENLEKRIRFLDKVDKVDWYKVVGKKNVVIGWKGLPNNFYEWNHRVAVKASKSALYEIHVWSVRHRQKDWKPGQGGQICMSTAKYGRFNSTDCRNTRTLRR